MSSRAKGRDHISKLSIKTGAARPRRPMERHSICSSQRVWQWSRPGPLHIIGQTMISYDTTCPAALWVKGSDLILGIAALLPAANWRRVRPRHWQARCGAQPRRSRRYCHRTGLSDLDLEGQQRPRLQRPLPKRNSRQTRGRGAAVAVSRRRILRNSKQTRARGAAVPETANSTSESGGRWAPS